MILVIACNPNHFEHWCREIGLNPRDRTSVIYIAEPVQLRGLLGRTDIEIVTLPEWWKYLKPEHEREFTILIEEHKRRRVELEGGL